MDYRKIIFSYFKLATFGLLVSTNCACAQHQPANSVFMFKGTPALTGVYDTKPVYKLKGIKFAFKTDGPIRSTPAAVNGSLYFGSEDGNLYAIDAITGKQRWHFETWAPVNSSPAVSKGVVYFSSRNGNLYAVETGTGKQIWEYKTGAELGKENYWDYFLSSPNIVGETLYIGSGDGYLYAFDIKSKKLSWKFNAGSRIRTTPAVSGDNIVFGTMSGYIYCVNKQGKQLWKFASDGASIKFKDFNNDRTSIFCQLAVADGIVAVGGREGFIYGVDLKSGKQKWKITQDSASWILATAIKDGQLLIGGGSAGLVQSVNLQTGAEKWRYQLSTAVFSSITIAGDLMYFTDFTGNCFALNRKTGKAKWSFPMGAFALSTPIVANRMVYCSSDDGTMYGLSGSTTPDNDTLRAKKVVYFEGNKSANTFSAFTLGTGMFLRDYFVKAGYELLDAKALKEFMQKQLTEKSPSVIILADNKLPADVVEEQTPQALVRKYLDAGGKVVALGDNPLAYKTDPKTGEFKGTDYAIPSRVLGVAYPPRNETTGYYNSVVTAAGQKMGFRGSWITNHPVNPDKVSQVLARDEFGQAGCWIKNYGGPEGTGWLQLNIPREPFDLLAIRKAAEYGVGW